MSATKINFGLDIIIGAAFVLALMSGLTAESIHSRMEFHTFASLLMSIGIVMHLSLHRKWLAATSHLSEKSEQMKTSLRLNRLLGISWLWALLSGWHNHLDPIHGGPLHILAAVSMISILLIHLARHWKWVVTTTKRYWG